MEFLYLIVRHFTTVNPIQVKERLFHSDEIVYATSDNTKANTKIELYRNNVKLPGTTKFTIVPIPLEEKCYISTEILNERREEWDN